jgi:hypothetical protein
MLDELRRNFVREIVSRIEHRAQNAFDLELGIRTRFDLLDRTDQCSQAFECVVLALHRNQHAVRCDERVHCQHVERRRTVDEHDIVVIANLFQRIAQARLTAGLAHQLDFSGDEILIRRHQFEICVIERHHSRCSIAIAEQHLGRRALHRAFVDTATHRRVALRIDVDQQQAAFRCRERRSEIDAGRRFADAPFLIRDCENAMHTIRTCVRSRRRSESNLEPRSSDSVVAAADFHKMPLLVQTRNDKPMYRREFPATGQSLQLIRRIASLHREESPAADT